MCVPSSPKIDVPKVPSTPPPPGETAELFATAKDDADKLAINKKKKGTLGLKLSSLSPLAIPDTGAGGSSSGLFIP